MRRIGRITVLLSLGAVLAFGAFPRLVAVDPAACAPGAEVAVEGQNLGKENVAKLFLTAGGKDIELEVLEQSGDAIRFRVPDDTAHGQYNLMVQTAGPTPALMEQPVRLEIADAERLAEKAEEDKRVAEELAQPTEPEEPQAPAESPK